MLKAGLHSLLGVRNVACSLGGSAYIPTATGRWWRLFTRKGTWAKGAISNSLLKRRKKKKHEDSEKSKPGHLIGASQGLESLLQPTHK